MLPDRLTAYLRRPLVVEQRGRGLVVLILVMVWRKEPGRRGGILGLSLVSSGLVKTISWTAGLFRMRYELVANGL